jgi:hypothetical protein
MEQVCNPVADFRIDRYQVIALACNAWPVWAKAISAFTSSRYLMENPASQHALPYW